MLLMKRLLLPAAFVVVDVAVFIDSKYGSPDSLWAEELETGPELTPGLLRTPCEMLLHSTDNIEGFQEQHGKS